jgi:hypothetical protein
MNTTTAPTSAFSAPPRETPLEPQPILLILALCLRMTAGFGAICGECLRRLIAHARAQIGLQRTWSTEIAAIDASMRALMPDLAEALKNDPPKLRKKVWQTLTADHARLVALSQSVSPNCPAHLMEASHGRHP